jgi:hypothetical protein
MAGLVPAIHDLGAAQSDEGVDGRDKPGHDELSGRSSRTAAQLSAGFVTSSPANALVISTRTLSRP